MNQYANLLLGAGLIAAVAACDRDKEVSPGMQQDQPATEGQPATQQDPAAVDQPTAQQKQRPGQREVEEVVGREDLEEAQEELQDAQELVQDAANTLKKMKADPEMKKLLSRSSGVLIVPEYGRAGAGVGARGGEGVLMAHEDGKWSGPAFYDIGGISVGAQLGAEGGEIAMVLIGDQALNSLKGDNTFSLNAGADLTIVDYSAMAQANLGKDAVVLWSDKEGAFAGATLSVTDISFDDDENPAYYGKKVTAEEVLSGKVTGKQSSLQQELSQIK